MFEVVLIASLITLAGGFAKMESDENEEKEIQELVASYDDLDIEEALQDEQVKIRKTKGKPRFIYTSGEEK